MCTPTIRLVAAVVTCIAMPGSLEAQASEARAILEPGRRVRLTIPRASRWPAELLREGTLTRADADSIRLSTDRRDTLAFAWAGVRRVEVLVRSGSQRRHMLVGGLLGAMAGGVLGATLGEGYMDCGGTPGCTSRTDTGGSFLAGAAIGGAAGLVLGAALPTQRWRAVPAGPLAAGAGAPR